MGQALYRKHRPKSLLDVVGQEHVTTTLEQALKQGKISHAYLFTGPRGTGKTSIARIWAHAINDLPYTDDSSHIDIIEIDAASNRRIDEIRELRDKVYVAPTSATYKVYIIDEVHMLTREAFNALLKTLEEPPAHVVFILATTDAHKLPETIISRTQRFIFQPGDQAAVAAHLQKIAEKENIDIMPDAVQLLAEHGEGSFRDSVSLLDQAGSQGQKITASDVRKLLGLPTTEAITTLLGAVTDTGQPADIMRALSQLYDQGFQATAIAKQLAKRIREQFVAGTYPLGNDDALKLLGRLLEVPMAHGPERFLEIVLLQAATPAVEPVKAATSKVSVAPVKDPEPTEKPADATPKKASKTEKDEAPTPKKVPSVAKKSGAFNEQTWQTILQTLKKKHNTLYGVVRMAQPTFTKEDGLELAFAFAFHQKRINEASNRKKLSDVILEVTGKDIAIQCVVDKSTQTSPPTIETPIVPTDSKDITAISNIFGGGELLES